MSYRCGHCDDVVPKNRPRQLYIRYKTVAGLKQIAHELPVCDECKRHLENGRSTTEEKPSERSGRRIKTLSSRKAEQVFEK